MIWWLSMLHPSPAASAHHGRSAPTVQQHGRSPTCWPSSAEAEACCCASCSMSCCSRAVTSMAGAGGGAAGAVGPSEAPNTDLARGGTGDQAERVDVQVQQEGVHAS